MTRKRKIILLGGIVGIVALLAATAWFVIVSLQNSAETEIDQLANQLPGNREGSRPIGEGADGGTQTDTNIPTTPEPASTAQGQRLAVTVKYTREPQFRLTIDKVEATNIQSTTQYYQPVTGQPFSLIRILDANGGVVAEKQFTVATEVNLESPDGPPVTYPLPDSLTFMVIDLPAGTVPARVQIANPGGSVLDEETIEFSLSAKAGGMLARIRDWFTAYAQNSNIFTIVVINEAGGESTLGPATAAVHTMLTLEPWATYVDRMQIVTLVNQQYLGCTSITLPSGQPYPVCPNPGQIFQAIAAINPTLQPNAIVVATDFPCNCGTVVNQPIVAVGSGVEERLVIHEFGHAVGGMVDEYYYQFGVTEGPLDSNCFESETSCQQATIQFPTAQCSLGCRTISSWRPASQIMHNTYSPLAYGPLEECILREKIADVLGEQVDCGSPEETPSPTPQITGDYWGWIAP